MPDKQIIVQLPARVLRQRAKELSVSEIKTPKIQKLIKDMKETLAATEDGVGLAAPQVAQPLRLFIVSEEALEIDRLEQKQKKHLPKESKEETGEKQEKKKWNYCVFINPVMKHASRKKREGFEGCLSVRGKYGAVRRNEKITVEAYDEHGKKFTRGASRFFARVLQHELDHLEGLLFIDKAKEIFETSETKKLSAV